MSDPFIKPPSDLKPIVHNPGVDLRLLREWRLMSAELKRLRSIQGSPDNGQTHMPSIPRIPLRAFDKPDKDRKAEFQCRLCLWLECSLEPWQAS